MSISDKAKSIAQNVRSIKPVRKESAGAEFVRICAYALLLLFTGAYIKNNKKLFLIYTGGILALSFLSWKINAPEKVFVSALIFWWFIIWTIWSIMFPQEKKSFWKRLFRRK